MPEAEPHECEVSVPAVLYHEGLTVPSSEGAVGGLRAVADVGDLVGVADHGVPLLPALVLEADAAVLCIAVAHGVAGGYVDAHRAVRTAFWNSRVKLI